MATRLHTDIDLGPRTRSLRDANGLAMDRLSVDVYDRKCEGVISVRARVGFGVGGSPRKLYKKQSAFTALRCNFRSPWHSIKLSPDCAARADRSPKGAL